MEVKLLQNEIPIWQIGDPIQKKAQFSAEMVIPDTVEDGKDVVWAKGGLFLKSKEPGLHSVTIAGEAWASVLILTETGCLEPVRVSKNFEISFEGETEDTEALPQISWYLSPVQARLQNPRKLSVSFEVHAVLTEFKHAGLLTEVTLPAGDWPGLHLLRQQEDVLALIHVSEKTFTLREQLSAAPGSVVPVHLDAEELRFHDLSLEQIGERSIIKGLCTLTVSGLDSDGFPARMSFSLPFSQLMDAPEAEIARSIILVVPNSVYLEWTEDGDGDSFLDAEIHAVIECRMYSSGPSGFISDAYSNRMPLTVQREPHSVLCALDCERCSLSGDYTFSAPDDMEEYLSAEASLGPLDKTRKGPLLPVVIDILYRKLDGSLGAARRSVKLSFESIPENALILHQQMVRFDLESDGREITFRPEAEILWEKETEKELPTITLLSLDDENPMRLSDLPDLSLVRREGESYWDLAKSYRSSEDLIRSCNAEDALFLVIPAE